MSQDNRPASVHHPKFNATLAHSWVRFDNGWLLTTCGIAMGPGEYRLFLPRTPVTCMTCLVKEATG